MSNALTEFILKENAKAEARARIEEKMNLATRLLKGYSMSNSEIALITDLSLVEVEKLAKEVREKEVTS